MVLDKLYRGVFLTAVTLLLCAMPVLAEDTPETDGLIVTFDDSVSNKKVKEVIEKADGECESIDQFSEGEKTAQISADDEEKVQETLEQNSYVNDVQPNYVYHFSASVDETFTDDPFSDKNDEYYQYYMDQLQVCDAWKLLDEKGGQKVKVGIIDTGVDVQHEDLQANLADKTSYCSFTNGNEYDLTEDSGEHGTHVSGIIGATADNDKGGSGVASGHDNNYIEMIMAGASEDGESLSSYSIAACLDYLEKQDVQVINMSFGQSSYDYYLDQQIHYAYEQGIILVAAAGNDGDSVYNYPAAFGDVISVNASNENGIVSYYSSYGDYSDITAPGTSVASTVPLDKYDRFSGTSMAAPVATSVVAMMLYANPDLNFQQVYDILCGTTNREKGSFDDKYAYGLINAYNSVSEAYTLKTSQADPEKIYTKKNSLTVNMNEPKDVTVLISPCNARGAVNYVIEDSSVAKIDHQMIWGLKPGKTTLMIICGGAATPVPVTVTGSEDDVLTSISIQQESMTIGLGVSDQNLINVDTIPASYTGSISYSSDNEKVAMVEGGYVWGVGIGTCTITARAQDGQEAHVAVTVKDAVGSIKFSKYKEWMKKGESSSFTADVYDTEGGKNVYNSGVTYKTSNSKVATVDPNGNVTAVGEGYCYIWAESDGAARSSSREFCRASVRLQVSKKDYAGADYNFTYKNGSLSWDEIPGITRYVIESSEDGNNFTTYKTLNASSLAVSKAKKCFYRMKAGYKIDGSVVYFGYSTKLTVNPDYKNYNLKKVKINAKKAEYKLTWNPCSYAKGYYILRKTGDGSFKKIATVGAVGSYKDTSTKAGTKYSYQVKAFASNDSYSNSASVTLVTTYSGKNYALKVKKHKLSWKKAAAATGYEIQRKTKGGKFRTIAKVKAVSSYVDKKARKNVTYKYRIRGIYDKNHMGWSVTK